MKEYGPAIAVVLGVLLIGNRFWSIYSRHEHGFQATFQTGQMKCGPHAWDHLSQFASWTSAAPRPSKSCSQSLRLLLLLW